MNLLQKSKDFLHNNSLESIYVESNSAQISSPKAKMLLIHGMGTYAGWFTDFQEQAQKQQILTHALDLPGFGRSGERGVIDSYQQWLTAITKAWQQIINTQPNLPSFLLGHSLGGVLALAARSQWESKPEGIILTAPGFAANLKSWSLFSFLLPTLIKALFNNSQEVTPPFPPEVAIALQENKHKLIDLTPKVRPKLLLEMAKVGYSAFWSYAKIKESLLMVLPAEENFCLNSVSQFFFHICESRDKELKIWPHLSHDLFVLPEAPQVNNHILHWVSQMTELKAS